MTVRPELAAGALSDLLFEEPGVGRCLVAPGGLVIRANAEWLRSTSRTLDQVLGRDVGHLFPQVSEMASRARSGQRVEIPRHALHVDGRETWWEGSIVPVPMEGGTGLLITVREVGSAAGNVAEAAPPEMRVGLAPRDGIGGEDPESRARTLEALKTRDVQFRALIEELHSGVALIDSSGRFSLYNHRFLDIFGLSQDSDIKNVNDQDWGAWQVFDERGRLLHVDEHPVRKAASTRRPVRDAFVGVRLPRGGDLTWLSVSAEPLLAADGSVDQIICTYYDVTDLKRAEEELRQSEERFRSLFENMLDGYAYCRMLFDEQGRPADFVYLAVNSAFARLTGLEDVIGKRVTEIIPGIRESQPELFETYGRVASTGRAERIETHLTRLDQWFHISVYGPSKDHFVAVFDNISERKRAEQALDAERMRWRGVIEGIADEVWVCDANGKMSLINLPETTAMGLDEFEGKTVEEVLREVDILYPDGRPRPPDEAPLLRSLRTGEIIRGEETMRHRPSGRVRHRQFSCAPVRDEAGNITGSVAIVRDITAQKRTEDALRDANAKLREADRLKQEFLSAASHELRTPLTTLSLHIQGLLRQVSTGPVEELRIRRKLSSMEGQIGRLNQLIASLLDVTRISSGRMHLERQRFDLAHVAADAVERFEDASAATGTTLLLDASPVVGVWDRVRIDQVLTNLLDNAMKYAPGSTVNVRVAMRDGDAVLSVSDSGPGISPESQARIFEQYERAAEAHAFGGLGLGLWIARQIVERHGGTIAVESAPGAGSTFTVRLPLEQQ